MKTDPQAKYLLVLVLLFQVPAMTQPVPPATIEVASDTITGIIESVDTQNKKLTVKGADDVPREYGVGTDQLNLNQIKPGDKIRITLLDSYAVYVGERATPDERDVRDVTLTPAPTQKTSLPPQAVLVATRMVNVQIVAVDKKMQTIEITELGGEPRTIPVAPYVNLDELESGDDVTIRVTEATAFVIEPQD